jgi:hypothetical protein
MRRACAILASACLLLLVGCRDYDLRLGETLEEMKYQQRLEKNLEKASTKGPLQTELIYVRPPKGLSGPTQTLGLPVGEPGKFDVENSFIDQAKQASLHVLARHKKPKAPPKKGVTPAAVAPRGDFTNEVIELVKTAYGVEDLTPSKFKAATRKHKGRENIYKEAKLDLNTKEVLIYLYGDKNGPYNIALIFEYPKTELNNLSPKIGLSLEAFAVGEAAGKAFAGGGEEAGEEGGEGGGGQAVPT